jgi:RiboL-PSP-HEPN
MNTYTQSSTLALDSRATGFCKSEVYASDGTGTFRKPSPKSASSGLTHKLSKTCLKPHTRTIETNKMINHTTAFKTFRDLSQSHLDFVVLVCHSIPPLKVQLQAPAAVLPKPDHFKGRGNTIQAIQKSISNYQVELARSTLITVFSYFEAYLKSVLLELIEFHGGQAQLQTKAKDRAVRFFASAPTMIEKNKRKLQDSPRPNKRAKYEKYGQMLDKAGFRFPTDLLSHFGVTQLALKADEKRGFKAHEIPSILEDALLYPLTAQEKAMLERIRLERNKIAHGSAAQMTLAQSLSDASSLHTLAGAVDSHISNHFLLIQLL